MLLCSSFWRCYNGRLMKSISLSPSLLWELFLVPVALKFHNAVPGVDTRSSLYWALSEFAPVLKLRPFGSGYSVWALFPRLFSLAPPPPLCAASPPPGSPCYSEVGATELFPQHSYLALVFHLVSSIYFLSHFFIFKVFMCFHSAIILFNFQELFFVVVAF